MALPKPDDHEPSNTRTYLVTGATGTIGNAIASQLAERPQAKVILVARNRSKAEQAVDHVKRASNNPHIYFELADLSRYDHIRALAERWSGPLHVLINNAACAPRHREETPDGIELQFAVNVLGYFWMTIAFAAILKASAPARVINVASYWAGDMDLTDLEFIRRPYRNDPAYRQSKQANRMLTRAFAERFKPFSVTVNACHPGDVYSTLSNNLGFGGHETPAESARTPVWLATDKALHAATGGYYEHQRHCSCPFIQNAGVIENLYKICADYTPNFTENFC
jgi:NAD(P)-dependent dehydrogenase (short-subunit alcohol dehydrogenase family)